MPKSVPTIKGTGVSSRIFVTLAGIYGRNLARKGFFVINENFLPPKNFENAGKELFENLAFNLPCYGKTSKKKAVRRKILAVVKAGFVDAGLFFTAEAQRKAAEFRRVLCASLRNLRASAVKNLLTFRLKNV